MKLDRGANSLQEFPYDSLLQKKNLHLAFVGLDERERLFKGIQDPDYMRLMMDDVDAEDIAASSNSEGGDNDDSDGEYSAEVDSDSDEDNDGEEDKKFPVQHFFSAHRKEKKQENFSIMEFGYRTQTLRICTTVQ